MLEKILASVGIGAARVDTLVRTGQVRPGGALEGEVHVAGGAVDQTVDLIELVLLTHYVKETDEHRQVVPCNLATFRISDQLVIRSGELRRFPFSIRIPYYTPATLARQQIFLQTRLDIAMALDPKDVDPIQVAPDPMVESLLAQAQGLGFRHGADSGQCKHVRRGGGQPPFVQEFELKPTGALARDLDELELSFDVHADGVQVLVQVDRRARGLMGHFAESWGLDESYLRLALDRRAGVAPDALRQLIQGALNRR